MNEHGYTKSSDESIDSIAQALTEEAELQLRLRSTRGLTEESKFFQK